MRVLIGCEFSGIVREEFAKLGHDAWSCDLIESEQEGNHIIGDVRTVLDRDWDLAIFHPPCTFLCNSGVRWLYEKPGRWNSMREGAEFFRTLLNAPIPRIMVENPIMHSHAVRIVGRKHDQVIHPWQFGHGEIKSTCLWLKNLPKLEPTEFVQGRIARVHRASPGPDRWKERQEPTIGVRVLA